jgi:putative acetyltransferase
MDIRHTRDDDIIAITRVVRNAFGSDIEARLVAELLADPSAEPRLSLLAVEGEQVLGHALFTRVTLDPPAPLEARILCPMAVQPGRQRDGVGSALLNRGLQLLRQAGVEAVFVLGHRDYYPRFGFEPACPLGLEPSHPVDNEYRPEWMVTALQPGALEGLRGRVSCSDTLNRGEYWGA